MHSIVAISLVGVLTLATSQAAFAQEGGGEREGVVEGVGRTVENVVEKVEQTTSESSSRNVDTLREASKERAASQKAQIETRKQELKDSIKKQSNDRKEKLEGRRLAQCQNRQKAINELMDKSVSVGKDRLARIQRFEAGVKSFYIQQNLTLDNYDELIALIDQKEAAAIAAIDVASAEQFTCDDVDGANPSGAIKTSHEAKRGALNEYKSAVRQLIGDIKKSFDSSTDAKEAV